MVTRDNLQRSPSIERTPDLPPTNRDATPDHAPDTQLNNKAPQNNRQIGHYIVGKLNLCSICYR